MHVRNWGSFLRVTADRSGVLACEDLEKTWTVRRKMVNDKVEEEVLDRIDLIGSQLLSARIYLKKKSIQAYHCNFPLPPLLLCLKPSQKKPRSSANFRQTHLTCKSQSRSLRYNTPLGRSSSIAKPQVANTTRHNSFLLTLPCISTNPYPYPCKRVDFDALLTFAKTNQLRTIESGQ